MAHEQLRVTAGSAASPLTDVVLRSLQETGELSVRGLRTPGFRALSPLIDRAQLIIDRVVIQVGMARLTFVADLLAEGLTYNLPDPLSVTQIEWSRSNKVGAAERVMTPSHRKENKLPDVLASRLPVYLTIDGFELDIRTLRMSQRIGMPLDTNLIAQCTRSVNEGLEDAAINGATTLDGQDLVVAGYSAPGLLNAPNANTQTLTAAAWDATPDGAVIFAEVQAMIAKLVADFKFGPYNLYLPTTVGAFLEADFKAFGAMSIRQRLEQMVNGGRGLNIRTADMMPVNKAALVQMTTDVVDIVDGQRPTVIPWTSLDGFTIHNLVMAIMIPRVRSDYNGNSGICIGTIQ